MSPRLNITKTHKLFIKGAFPRSESGRSIAVADASGHVVAHVPQGSRKDLRDAVVAARGALEGWSARSAYNRGQILYRMAEMLEGKRAEFAEVIEEMRQGPSSQSASGKKKTNKEEPRDSRSSSRASRAPMTLSPVAEVDASIDRLVAFAGWADKFSQVLGCHNMVNGPYYNFTVAEATGVAAVVTPDAPALLGLVSLIAPVLCSGGVVVALGSEREPMTACMFGEVCATSDVPAGVINILTGHRAELVPQIAGHRDIDAIHAANLPTDQAQQLRDGAPDSVKRVRVREVADWTDVHECESPWWIEPFVEMKTIWHPAAS